MACFLISAGEAVVSTIVASALEKKEKAQAESHVQIAHGASEHEAKIPFSRKVKWLRNMLWGGSALLAFEHVWHGELAPWFPFLTAAGDPASTAEMLHEMATVGVAMAALVTVVWLGMVGVSSLIEKRSGSDLPAEN